ncbi:DUF4430 domain-containing protein [Brochothrix campestris]|uniref:Transcobalamin-like C-terminal domain-containing protein n=1 Tax=Brochothrix campestris FSL F6-1037 TaxID=1265861 RepID=W7CJ25_9LIST|nr:DUF4430 domain-containing protein [Brochothrix campestris]EUJ36972.1 hypothetical protein BCAMP_10260 [Brochothrix campestris FSL F6-1037]
MKKSFKTPFLILVSLCLLFVLSACSSNKETDKKATNTTETATITLQQEGKQIAKKDVSFATETSLLDIMKDNFTVVEKDGFVTSLNDVVQNTDKQMYWLFTINDKEVTTGANKTTLKKGDKVLWKLEEMEIK